MRLQEALDMIFKPEDKPNTRHTLLGIKDPTERKLIPIAELGSDVWKKAYDTKTLECDGWSVTFEVNDPEFADALRGLVATMQEEGIEYLDSDGDSGKLQ